MKHDSRDSPGATACERVLARDEADLRPVASTLCKWGVVHKKLIPLLKASRDDKELVLTLIKIFFMMTKPASPALIKRANTEADPETSEGEQRACQEQQRLAREQVLSPTGPTSPCPIPSNPIIPPSRPVSGRLLCTLHAP